MDTLQAIQSRISVRKYTPEVLTEKQLHTVLHAGMCAPSAHNFRPWHFVTVQKRESLTHLAEVSKYAKSLHTAPCAIVVCGDTERQHFNDFLQQDCAAVIQNMLLAAQAIGLATVWLGIVQGDEWSGEVEKCVGLPGHIKPIGVIALGHGAEAREPKERFEADKVHPEAW